MSSTPETDLNQVERLKIERTYDRLQRLNYYEILHLPQSATGAQIKKGYYTVSKEFHPDRFFRRSLGEYKEKLEAIFDLLTKAYNTLNDPNARSEYDRTLIEESVRRGPAVHEISMSLGDAGKKARTRANAERSAQEPENGGKQPAPPPKVGPSARAGMPPRRPAARPAGPRPVFMDRFQQQLVERMKKGREYLKTGKTAFDKGQFGPAMSALQMAVAFDPRNAEAKELLEEATTRVNEVKAETHYQRGLQEEMVGNLDSARQFFKMAVDCKPKKGYYYYKLGQLELGIPQDKRHGMEHIRQALEYEPRNIEYLTVLAKAFEEADMPRNAIRECEKILAVDKTNEGALKTLKRLKSAL